MEPGFFINHYFENLFAKGRYPELLFERMDNYGISF